MGDKGKLINNRDCIDHMRVRVLLALLRIIEIHEHSIDTVRHSDRVAAVSNLIGKEIGFPDREIAVLWRSALLHDIGKIGISKRDIYGKKWRFFDRKVIENHPQWAYDIIKILGFWNYEGLIVRQHHENFDGSGYPNGLMGKDIHIFARIIHIADVYDALVTFRSYRIPWRTGRAVGYLLRKSGSMFDPDLVNIFIVLSHSNRFKNLYG